MVSDIWILFVKRLMRTISVESIVGETYSSTLSIAANSNAERGVKRIRKLEARHHTYLYGRI